MPEFGGFLSFMQKLRLGVPQRSPRQLAVMLADIQRTDYNTEHVGQLEHIMAEVILEVHGVNGLLEFTQEYLKRTRR